MAKRSSKRKLKVPVKLNDYEMDNMSQLKGQVRDKVDTEDTRMTSGDEMENIGENDVGRKEDLIQTPEKVTETNLSNKDVNYQTVNNDDTVFGNGMDSTVDRDTVNTSKVNGNNVKDTEMNSAGNNNNTGDRDLVNASEVSGNNVKDTEVIEIGENNNENDVSKEQKASKSSYANVVRKDNKKLLNKLIHVPTVVNEEGCEVVIFDEELIKKGSVQWSLTICGFFVGYNMNVNELRYHIRRMWGKYGIGDIRTNADGTCIFKFRNTEGMNKVLKQGPWMVNHKPLFVQKWDPEIGMIKAEPDRIPVWVKLMNVPLEAWSLEGISALASSLGKPLIMDSMTAAMCQFGEGRLDFARVLVEIEAVKGFKDKVIVQYKDSENNMKGTKEVKVEYDWKPTCCKECRVFSHDYKECTLTVRTIEEIEEMRKATEEKAKLENKKNDGNRQNTVEDAPHKSNLGQKFGANGGKYDRGNGQGQKKEFRRKSDKKDRDVERNGNSEKQQTQVNGNNAKSKWKVKEEDVEAIRRSANKYAILESHEEEERQELNLLKDRMIVDKYLNRKEQPTKTVLNNWSKDMSDYFHAQWKIDRLKEQGDPLSEIEEVLENNSEAGKLLVADEIQGKDKTVLH